MRKRKPGRPAKPKGEMFVRWDFRLPPDISAFLKRLPRGTRSQFVQQALRESIAKPLAD